MEARHIWQLFLDTGAPELYVIYNKARNAEENHVFNDSGTCSESNGVQ